MRRETPASPPDDVLSIDGPVLVGTDDSARSGDALALGLMLADVMRSQLLPVYVNHFEDVGALLSGGPTTEALKLIDQVAASKNRRAQALVRAAGASPLPMATAPTVAAGLHRLAVSRRARSSCSAQDTRGRGSNSRLRPRNGYCQADTRRRHRPDQLSAEW